MASNRIKYSKDIAQAEHSAGGKPLPNLPLECMPLAGASRPLVAKKYSTSPIVQKMIDDQTPLDMESLAYSMSSNRPRYVKLKPRREAYKSAIYESPSNWNFDIRSQERRGGKSIIDPRLTLRDNDDELLLGELDPYHIWLSNVTSNRSLRSDMNTDYSRTESHQTSPKSSQAGSCDRFPRSQTPYSSILRYGQSPTPPPTCPLPDLPRNALTSDKVAMIEKSLAEAVSGTYPRLQQQPKPLVMLATEQKRTEDVTILGIEFPAIPRQKPQEVSLR